jgi:hypothetical protein
MDDKVENMPNGAIPHTVGIFTTQVVQCLADGRRLVFQSRRHRKALPPIQIGSDGIEIRAALASNPWRPSGGCLSDKADSACRNHLINASYI